MAFTTVYKTIVFVKGDHPSAKRGPLVSCDLSFKFGAQLKSLHDVKDKLAEQARSQGYNCILDFTYGQKSRWLAIDDIAFWGKGCLANIPWEEYKIILYTANDARECPFCAEKIKRNAKVCRFCGKEILPIT